MTRMILTLLLAFTAIVSAQNMTIPKSSLDDNTMGMWNGLVGYAEKIGDFSCFGELVQTLAESNTILGCSGLGPDFLKYLDNVKTVAGNNPDGSLFRMQFALVQSKMQSIYDAAIQETSVKLESSAAPISYNLFFYIFVSALALLA